MILLNIIDFRKMYKKMSNQSNVLKYIFLIQQALQYPLVTGSIFCL
jgi:hypothetical protein